MIGPKATNIYVYKQSTMVHNDCVVHSIGILSIIKPSLMRFIIYKILNFNQGAIYESSTPY